LIVALSWLRGLNLKALGKVLHISKSKKLIIKALAQPPPINTLVYDEKFNVIGVVYDIMGPVSSPYISVLVDKIGVEPKSLVGKTLYVKERRRRVRGR